MSLTLFKVKRTHGNSTEMDSKFNLVEYSKDEMDIFENNSISISINNDSLIENIDYLEIYNDESFVYNLPAMIYIGVMMLLGIPGNMVVFYIYFFKWRRSTSRMFILFLAAIDTMNCSTTLPIEMFIMRNSLKLDYPFLCKISRYSTYVMNSSSALILVGIALDRFKRICRPYERAFSADKSRYISIAAILFSLGNCWPSLILYGTRKVDLGKAIGSACLLENHYDKTPYPLLFFSYMVATTFILFAIIIVLYYFVGIQIYKHRKFKLKKCTHVQKIVDERSITPKSETSNPEKLKSSNISHSNGKDNAKDSAENGCVTVKEATDIKAEQAENELRPYQLDISPVDPDPATTCGVLEVHCQKEGLHVTEMSPKRNITLESRVTYKPPLNEVKIEDNENGLSKMNTPQRRKSKSKKKTRRIRYLLVRGASTLNASSAEPCSSCLTVRIGRSTLMLFLITLVFVLSFLPFYVLIIVRQSDSTFVKRLSKGGLMAYHVFLRSYLLSSVVNPFIYSFCNVQFRDICKETFLKVVLRRNPSFINRSKITRRKY